MSQQRRALKYDCADMCAGPGYCGKKNQWLLTFYNSSDTFTLVHVQHVGEADEQVEHVLSGPDEKYSAMIDIFTTSHGENPKIDIQHFDPLDWERWHKLHHF